MNNRTDQTSVTSGDPGEIQYLRRELDEASRRLAESQKQKSGLLAMAVHDLRTPLAIIQGYSQLLAADLPPGLEDTAAHEYLTNIIAHADSLAKMVENLLALDQIERGALNLRTSRANLNQLVEDGIAQVEGLAKIKTIDIQYQPAPNPVPVMVDEEQIHRAIYNLLSHSIKYARPNSKLLIVVDHDSGLARLSFVDPNRQVHTAILDRLFDLAEVGQDSIDSLRGMDMGLVLTRHVAEYHGGGVEAFCDKGHGMTIVLTLPADTWQQNQ